MDTDISASKALTDIYYPTETNGNRLYDEKISKEESIEAKTHAEGWKSFYQLRKK